MSQNQRLQQVASVLREKANQFDTNKERSKKQILAGIQELRDLINTVEESLLRKIDTAFGENPFAAALCDIDNNNGSTSVDYNNLERCPERQYHLSLVQQIMTSRRYREPF